MHIPMEPIAVIGDIHGNQEALDAVLQDIVKIQEIPAKNIICAGDIVGYGPDPDYCVETMQELNIPCIAGNHDVAVVRKDYPAAVLNPEAGASLGWTRKRMKQRNKDFLAKLAPCIKTDDYILVHGVLLDDMPETCEYDLAKIISSFYYIRTTLRKRGEATVEPEEMFERMDKPLAFTAHSHEGLVISYPPVKYPDFERDDYINAEKLIVNVGSVGQPRDNDSRAGYVVWYPDRKEFRLIRVRYNNRITAQKIKNTEKYEGKEQLIELPRSLALRLRKGE